MHSISCGELIKGNGRGCCSNHSAKNSTTPPPYMGNKHFKAISNKTFTLFSFSLQINSFYLIERGGGDPSLLRGGKFENLFNIKNRKGETNTSSLLWD